MEKGTEGQKGGGGWVGDRQTETEGKTERQREL